MIKSTRYELPTLNPRHDFMLAHIAVAVTNLEDAAVLYRALGFDVGEVEEVGRESVRLRKAFKDGLCVELLEPFPADSGGIAKFLSKRGPGLHHIALQCENIVNDLKGLEKQGIVPLKGYPAIGSEGTHVAFLDPKTTGGVLIELVEEKKPSAF